MSKKFENVSYHVIGNNIFISGITENYNIIKVNKDTPNGIKVVEYLKDEDYESIANLLDKNIIINKFTNNEFEFKNGVIYNGKDIVNTYIAQKIIEFYENGLPYKYLLNFYNKIRMNPSRNSMDDIYRFVESNKFTITSDGCIIAYKRVTSDFKDAHTRTFDNSIGKIVSMPREDVDDDSNVACSRGLHVASWGYAKDFYGGAGGKLIEVKVDPVDIVSVPFDYGNEKCRCCKYEVLRECTIKDESYIDIIEFEKEESGRDVDDVPFFQDDESEDDGIFVSYSEVATDHELMKLKEIKIGNFTYTKISFNNFTKATDLLGSYTISAIKRSKWPKSLNAYDIASITRVYLSCKNCYAYVVFIDDDNLVVIEK